MVCDVKACTIRERDPKILKVGDLEMTIMEEIIVECLQERVENFIEKFNRLRDSEYENYSAFESIALDLISELKGDIEK